MRGILSMVFVGILLGRSEQANILMMATLMSHSHHFWNEAIAIGLVDKGHNVTVLSHDYTQIKRDNFTVITIDGAYDTFAYAYKGASWRRFSLTPFNLRALVDDFNHYFNIELCEFDLNHPAFDALLSYPDDFKFDLILWDHTAGECLYPVIERFGNPPLVGLSPYGLTNSIEALYGGHVYPYIGQIIMPFTIATTLWQRLFNTIYINYSNYKRISYLKPVSVEVSQTKFPNWNIEKFEEVENRFSLCFVNWNVALNHAQPMNPNIIPVGGVQIKEKELLPKDIQEIFSKPSKGVIYFSLGSNIKSEYLSLELLQSFGDCFAELSDYQVLWKLEPPANLSLPTNVVTVKWAPQTAVLAQKKTKMFITHGGGLSTQETTYAGVPIVALPLFLDQINNAEKLRERGGGETVTLEELEDPSQNIFCKRVKQVLHNACYTRTMKDSSAKYRDVKVKPLDEAVFWTEYVLRHGDIKHLSPKSRSMNCFVEFDNLLALEREHETSLFPLRQ
ncbi:UDP-glucosyltransferase 2-like [Atheta coriaria]|uniref:UDP-glucosyltransferase 2-like n=1 Tax=Dalotia coriaria TaxID=877792 RepID=UPI0031F393AE